MTVFFHLSLITDQNFLTEIKTSDAHCKPFPVRSQSWSKAELEQGTPAAFRPECPTVGKDIVWTFLCSVVKQKEHPCGCAAQVSENN